MGQLLTRSRQETSRRTVVHQYMLHYTTPVLFSKEKKKEDGRRKGKTRRLEEENATYVSGARFAGWRKAACIMQK